MEEVIDGIFHWKARHPQIESEVRFGCPIICHEAGLYEFEDGPEVDGFAFGERLAADVVALEMDSISPDDTALMIESGGGALLFADSLIHRDAVGFVSDRLIGDNPEEVKQRIRERCDALLTEKFEHLLFAHGDPLLGNGREALRRVVRGS